MSQPSGNLRCTATCYLVGLVAGAVAAIMLILLGSFSWSGAIFTAIVIALAIGVFLGWTVCRPLPTFDQDRSRHDTKAGPGRTGTAASGSAAPPAAASAAASSAGGAAARSGTGSAGTGSTGAASTATAAPTAATEAAPADDRAAGAESAPTANAGPASAGAATMSGAAKPSPELPGQPATEIERGDGTDEGGATSAPATGSPAPTDAEKPPMLSAPGEGGADDLKRIKGVGPKLEQMLNEMGVYHFSQVAAWNDREAGWVDDNLEGFRGRVSRDDWVAQARILAAGGDTAFAKTADGGDAY